MAAPRKALERKPADRKPSAAEIAARARAMKGNPELREQFGIDEDHPRELVKVDALPDPPPTLDLPETRKSPDKANEAVNLDQAILQVFTEEAEEIRVRLSRFGVPFTAMMQQDMVDHLFTLIALNQQGILGGGGAIARR